MYQSSQYNSFNFYVHCKVLIIPMVRKELQGHLELAQMDLYQQSCWYYNYETVLYNHSIKQIYIQIK